MSTKRKYTDYSDVLSGDTLMTWLPLGLKLEYHYFNKTVELRHNIFFVIEDKTNTSITSNTSNTMQIHEHTTEEEFITTIQERTNVIGSYNCYWDKKENESTGVFLSVDEKWGKMGLGSYLYMVNAYCAMNFNFLNDKAILTATMAADTSKIYQRLGLKLNRDGDEIRGSLKDIVSLLSQRGVAKKFKLLHTKSALAKGKKRKKTKKKKTKKKKTRKKKKKNKKPRSRMGRFPYKKPRSRKRRFPHKR
jgi:hypothetical protein